MPGDIDEESIIENKPAIKHYWESKMRENAASQFARSQFGVSSPTIIDKINDEIRDDYMRNLELMQDEGLPRSSASDTSDEPIEFDSFDMASSSNNSSPFGQPHDASSPLLPESPTLIDSGHQSQESQAADHDDPENDPDSDHKDAIDSSQTSQINGNNVNNNNVSSQGQKKPLSHSYSYGSYTGIPKLGQQQQQQQGKYGKKVPTVGGYRSIVESNRQTAPANHGKIENHVTHYITFNKPLSIKVKPIDEPSTTTTTTSTPAPPPSSEREKSPPKQQKEVAEEKSLSLSIKPSQETGVEKTSTLKSPKTDISYMLATSRLKKEIEDNLKREKELKAQGRVRTLSVDTVQSPTPTPSSQLGSPPPQSPEYVVQKQEKRVEEPERTNNSSSNNNNNKIEEPAAVAKQPTTKEIEEPVINNNVAETPATTTTATANNNVDTIKPQQQQRPPQSSTYPNFKIGKNFNSLERYIMYSSMTKLNFRSMPPAWSSSSSANNGGTSPSANNSNANLDFEEAQSNGPTEGNSTNQNKNFQISLMADEAEEDPEPTEKVRKNYVPAEKRIKEELLEMVQREEELKQTRQQWKSTPNLSNLNLSDDEEETRAEETVQRRPHQAPRWGVEKRRRSALISKWEEMISQNNPQ